MRRSTLAIFGYLFLVFSSGILVGGFGYRFLQGTPVAAKAPVKPSPEEFRRQYLRELQAKAKLTPDQLQKVDSIMDQTRERFHQARDNHDQVIKTIREEQRQKVRAILSDEQKVAYEQFRDEREKRAKAAAAAQGR